MNEEFQVTWTLSARADLIEIIKYIAADNKASAKRIANKIKEKARRLCSFPERGRVVPELQKFGMLMYRELIVKPWRIVYRIERKVFLF